MKRVALGLLLLLLVGLVVADRYGEQVAERRIAEQVAVDLGTEPDVEIDGVFLLQALRGRYDRILVTADRVRLRDVPVRDFTATLTGVDLPVRTALAGAPDGVPAEQLRSTGLLAWDDLERQVGGQLQLGAAGDQVRVSGTVAAFGQEAPAEARADVAVDGDALVLRVRALTVSGQSYTGPLPAALGGDTGLRVPVPELPYGLRLASARPQDDGLLVEGVGRDVVLRRPGR